MHFLDILILVALAAGVVRGFTTGLIRQITSVVGLVVSFVLAVSLMEPAGALVVDSLGTSERVAPIVGFVLVFVALQALLFVLIRTVEALVGVLRLTTVNRLLGGLLGAAKAALILSVLFLVLGHIGVPERQTRVRSSLYEPVASVLPRAWDFFSSRLPEVRELSERFGQRVDFVLPEGSE